MIVLHNKQNLRLNHLSNNAEVITLEYGGEIYFILCIVSVVAFISCMSLSLYLVVISGKMLSKQFPDLCNNLTLARVRLFTASNL